MTPILMSYVNRYIKNLKPSDLQLSLWGGDVVLSKLELKLDVLEQVRGGPPLPPLLHCRWLTATAFVLLTAPHPRCLLRFGTLVFFPSEPLWAFGFLWAVSACAVGSASAPVW